jgi:maltodextrin utilization protein YvdJ
MYRFAETAALTIGASALPALLGAALLFLINF